MFSEKKQSNFCVYASIEQLQNFFLLFICFNLSLTKDGFTLEPPKQQKMIGQK